MVHVDKWQQAEKQKRERTIMCKTSEPKLHFSCSYPVRSYASLTLTTHPQAETTSETLNKRGFLLFYQVFIVLVRLEWLDYVSLHAVEQQKTKYCLNMVRQQHVCLMWRRMQMCWGAAERKQVPIPKSHVCPCRAKNDPCDHPIFPVFPHYGWNLIKLRQLKLLG